MKIPIDKFRNYLLNKNLKNKTVEEYLYYFNRFLIYEAFTQENVGRFLSKKENMNGVSRSFLMNLRKFLMINYREMGLSPDNRLEISEIELPQMSGRTKERLVKPLTEEQILQIEKHLPTERERLQLFMSYYGGLRIGELFRIRVISFNWEEWKKDMNQVGECSVLGKGNKEGLAFFPPSLMKRIATYIRSQDYKSLSAYLFMKKVGDAEEIDVSNKVRTWQNNLKNAGIKAGITKLDAKGKIIHDTRVHPHKLRHSWGYYLKNVKKMDIRDIQEILRHSSIVSTQRYTYVDKSDLKKMLSKDVFAPQV